MSKMDNIINKGLLLHGVGAGVLTTVSNKVLELTTSQSMKMDISATTEDVFGGDGLFPLYTYISKKEGSVEITNAEFKLSQLAIAQQVDIAKTGNKRSFRTLIHKGDTKVAADAMTGVEVIAVIAPDGSNVTDKVKVTATGALDTGVTLDQDGEYAVWFKADDANAVKASMLKNAMPEVATLNWQFTTESSDGIKYQIDIYARRVRADGKFSIDTSRDKASTPSLKVNILDPGDGHDDFAVITVTRLA